MGPAIKAILIYLLSKQCIGGKHTSEDKLIRMKIKWLSSEDKHEFKKEYRWIVNLGIIIRLKKKTGKGSDWHICLNPRKIGELEHLLDE